MERVCQITAVHEERGNEEALSRKPRRRAIRRPFLDSSLVSSVGDGSGRGWRLKLVLVVPRFSPKTTSSSVGSNSITTHLIILIRNTPER